MNDEHGDWCPILEGKKTCFTVLTHVYRAFTLSRPVSSRSPHSTEITGGVVKEENSKKARVRLERLEDSERFQFRQLHRFGIVSIQFEQGKRADAFTKWEASTRSQRCGYPQGRFLHGAE